LRGGIREGARQAPGHGARIYARRLSRNGRRKPIQCPINVSYRITIALPIEDERVILMNVGSHDVVY
jgi:hypothetical protein